MPFQAGQRLRASQLAQIGTLVGRNQRTTNSAAYTTIARILSVRAPIIQGRTYRVQYQAEEFSTGAVPNTGQTELRFTTNDAEPIVTSPVMARALVRHDADGIPDAVTIIGYHYASVTGFLRVAVCGTRVVGTGSLATAADAQFPAAITIEDVGDTITPSGTVY